jgi:hypothetical protein
LAERWVVSSQVWSLELMISSLMVVTNFGGVEKGWFDLDWYRYCLAPNDPYFLFLSFQIFFKGARGE